MRTIKDGLMACEPGAQPQTTFLTKFTKLRKESIRLLEVHDHETPDRYWQSNDPEANRPRTLKNKSRLKLCLTLTFNQNQKPVFPPPNTRLSDELVYLATKFLKNTDRARDYPYDFDQNGDINPTRVPAGAAPLIWAHGLPFFPVYKGYYILCGRAHAKWIGWMLNAKDYKLATRFPMWTIGPVVAPASAVEMTRTVERQLRVHKAWHTRDYESGEESSEVARDVVSTLHCDLSIVPTGSVDGVGFCLCPIYVIPGYNVHCGPDGVNRVADVVEERAWREKGIQGFDYAKALVVPYVNQRYPLADPEKRVAKACAGEDGNGMEKQATGPNAEQDEMVCDEAVLGSHQDHQTLDTQFEDDETAQDNNVSLDMESNRMGNESNQPFTNTTQPNTKAKIKGTSPSEERRTTNPPKKPSVKAKAKAKEDHQSENQQHTTSPRKKSITKTKPKEKPRSRNQRLASKLPKKPVTKVIHNTSPWKTITVPKPDLNALLAETRHLSDEEIALDNGLPSRAISLLKRTWQSINQCVPSVTESMSVARPAKKMKVVTGSTSKDEGGFPSPSQGQLDGDFPVPGQETRGSDDQDGFCTERTSPGKCISGDVCPGEESVGRSEKQAQDGEDSLSQSEVDGDIERYI